MARSAQTRALTQRCFRRVCLEEPRNRLELLGQCDMVFLPLGIDAPLGENVDYRKVPSQLLG